MRQIYPLATCESKMIIIAEWTVKVANANFWNGLSMESSCSWFQSRTLYLGIGMGSLDFHFSTLPLGLMRSSCLWSQFTNNSSRATVFFSTCSIWGAHFDTCIWLLKVIYLCISSNNTYTFPAWTWPPQCLEYISLVWSQPGSVGGAHPSANFPLATEL